MTDPAQFWASFTLDPRSPEHAGLRASDADRNVIHQALADAYSDGRLDREEFEARTADTTEARTLGDLVAQVDGLVPTSWAPVVRPKPGLLSDAQIRERAVEEWQNDRRNAIWGFISASLICWLIWAFTSAPGFPWPVFVMLGTGLNLGRIQFQRQTMIDEERRRLERKQAREIEKRRRRGELG
jgi:Domain of unknown function (DUF1707)